jgi:hypothetical protein
MERVIEFKGAIDTLLVAAVLEQFLQIDTLNIEVTADKARTIILPEYNALININVKINVIDKTGTAKTNNITIQTQNPDLINGSTAVLINTDYGYAQVTGATLNKTKQYACMFGGASSSSAGGGGSSVIGVINTFSVTLQPARVIQMLNDTLQSETLIVPPPPNKFIQLLGANLILGTGSTPYDGNLPRFYIGYFGGNKPSSLFYSSDRNLFAASGGQGFAMVPNIAPASTSGIVSFGNPLLLYSGDDYTVTTGDIPVTINGSYILLDLP